MEKKDKKKLNMYVVLLCIVIFALIFYRGQYKDTKVSLSQNYAIATVTGFGDNDVYFYFEF